MRIFLNNLEQPTNIICFTDIPNILKIDDSGGYGRRAIFNIYISGNLSEDTIRDDQWHVSFMGETISNVLDPNNAINKNFWVSNTSLSTAASMTRAFRNCPNIAANFTVDIVYDSSSSLYGIQFVAKQEGNILSTMDNYYSTNIGSSYITASGEDGYPASFELYNSLISVDIYTVNNNYEELLVTTLEKTCYKDEVSFNLSPVLTTFAEYGRAREFTIRITKTKDGICSLLGNIGTNFICIGYMCNQGAKFLDGNYLTIAQNFSRGTNKDAENNTILYIYKPEIDFSFYNGNAGAMYITIDYLDSAFNTITSTTFSWRNTDSMKKLWDINYSLFLNGYGNFNSSFYIDVTLGTLKMRYNVIKPIKATEECQRLLWRNSYGGISFFDFTGQKSETRDLTTITYEKNILGYYDEPMNELEKIYDNDVKYTVTLKSHLFEEDGKYIFNDLIQSSNVWTEVNGEKYAVIIDSVSVDEVDNNGIYEATVKYHYSQEPSLI